MAKKLNLDNIMCMISTPWRTNWGREGRLTLVKISCTLGRMG